MKRAIAAVKIPEKEIMFGHQINNMHKLIMFWGEEREFWIRDSEKSKRTTKHKIMEIKQSIIEA